MDGPTTPLLLFNLAHRVYIVKRVCMHCFAAIIGILYDLLLQWISELKIAALSVDHILLKDGELDSPCKPTGNSCVLAVDIRQQSRVN